MAVHVNISIQVKSCAQLRSVAEKYVLWQIELHGTSAQRVFYSHCLDLSSTSRSSSSEVAVNAVLVCCLQSVAFGAPCAVDGSCSLRLAVSDHSGAHCEVVVTSASARLCGNMRRFYAGAFSSSGGVVVVVRALGCCLVEEHPEHSELSCRVLLVVDETQLTFVTDSGPWPMPSSLQAIPPATAHSGSRKDLQCHTFCVSGVRDALTGARGEVLEGVVVGKLASDNFKSVSDNKSQRNGTHSQCVLTLRDRRQSDAIKLFLPMEAASGLVVGMVVRVRGHKQNLPESGKKPYFSDRGAPSPLAVDFVRFVSPAELRAICSEMRSLHSSPRHLCRQGMLCPPPAITVNQLMQRGGINYCLWTVTGRVTFVRKVLVSLRCASCHRAPERDCRRCTRCDASASLRCLWESTVSLDDGSAECELHLEGDDAVAVLRSRFDPRGEDFAKIRVLVEQLVRRTGRFQFDTLDLCRQRFQVVGGGGPAEVDLEALEDSLFSLQGAPPSADWRSDEAGYCQQTLQSYLQGCRFSVHFKVVCSIGVASSSTAGAAARSRKVQLQEINSDFQHRVVFTGLPTAVPRKLCVEGHEVIELTGGSARSAAWELMNKLSGK